MATAYLNKSSLFKSADLLFEDTENSISTLKHISVGETKLNNEFYSNFKRFAQTTKDCLTVENLVINEEIKKGSASASEYIENYKATLLNLGKCGIKTIGYNFHPLFYKVCTHFSNSETDKSVYSFDPIAFATFDIYLLKRPNADKSYNSFQRHAAFLFNRRLSEQEKYQLCCNILRCLQVSGIRSLNALRRALDAYRKISNETLSYNLKIFQEQVNPVAKKAGIKLVFQEDEQSKGLLGLPYINRTLL